MTGAVSPFPPDPARAIRNAHLLATCSQAFAEALAAEIAGPDQDPMHPAAAVTPDAVGRLAGAFGLDGPEDAAVLALETAQSLARPPVSGYRVGAVGVDADGGLLLGGNLEWPGASIWQTVHGEGFVALLARARRTRVATLVTSQARPCAHCRQVLAEMAWSDELVLADPPGRHLRMADIYPWPFAPADLGVAPATDRGDAFPYLGLAAPMDGAPLDLPPVVAAGLVAAGRRAHAPYSGCAAACLLVLADGTTVEGAVLESVAFNPTIGPAQDALVLLEAGGRRAEEVREAWLGVGRDAAIAHEAMARDLLAAACPDAAVHVRYWA